MYGWFKAPSAVILSNGSITSIFFIKEIKTVKLLLIKGENLHTLVK